MGHTQHQARGRRDRGAAQVFVIVPFMELALPLALKLFPNMLPSTFEDKDKSALERKKLFQVRVRISALWAWIRARRLRIIAMRVPIKRTMLADNGKSARGRKKLFQVFRSQGQQRCVRAHAHARLRSLLPSRANV